MLRKYSHTTSESFAQIHTIMAEIQHFSRGLFFIGTHCISYVNSSSKFVPLSSDRQHLSDGVCLEINGEIIGTVLHCIVYDSCAQS